MKNIVTFWFCSRRRAPLALRRFLQAALFATVVSGAAAFAAAPSDPLADGPIPHQTQSREGPCVADYADRIRALESMGKWDEAIAALTEILDRSPEDVAAYKWRAKLRIANGYYSAAVADLNQVIRRHPWDLESRRSRRTVRCYLPDEPSTAAVEVFEEVELMDFEIYVFWPVWRKALQAASTPRSVEDLRKAVGQAPRDGGPRKALGAALVNTGKANLAEAIAQYEAAIAIDPRDAEAWRLFGAAHALQEETAVATTELEKALELNPQDTMARCARAAIFTLEGNFKRSEAEWSKAVAAEPQWAVAHYGLGWSYRNSGQCAKAVDAFSEVIRLEPEWAVGYYGRGVAQQDREQFGPAIADFGHAVRLNPRFHNAYVHRGSCQSQVGDKYSYLPDFLQTSKMNLAHTDGW